MHDIHDIRERPYFYAERLQTRLEEPDLAIKDILAADARVRGLKAELQSKLSDRKSASAEIGKMQAQFKRVQAAATDFENERLHLKSLARETSIENAAGLRSLAKKHVKDFRRFKNNVAIQAEASAALFRKVEYLKHIIPVLEDGERAALSEYQRIASAIPNIPLDDVPIGWSENENDLVYEHGRKLAFDFAVQEHDALGLSLGLDFDTGVSIAGARFTLLRGPAAKLARALGQFGLDVLTKQHGYEEVSPPLLVRDDAVFGTGQLPKFKDDLFQTTDGRWLIPTAEVSLTNIVRERILAADELPLRFTALTPCFRSEAGAAGRDTRGYIRQHQFEKAEMVSIVAPDQSEAEHERMTAAAEDVLTRLELPFRRMKLCTGDMGFSAARTYDLEVWLPGQQRYREISSCSTCTDFQARRMNARYRPEGEKGTRFVHTLNGSGLVVGRMLVAILENYQQADGSVAVPTALQPYLGGLNRLEPRG